MARRVRIGIVATGSRFAPEVAGRVRALAAERYGDRVELVVHPNGELTDGHFAGPDEARAQAFLELANDPAIHAIWIARGGYGACRLLDVILPRLGPAARDKAYLGYSDAGSILGALYAAGIGRPAHGPVAQDVLREGGERAVLRALAWLVDGDPATLEPSLGGETRPVAAFNLTIFSHLLGTPWEPDLSGHVLMLEEVSEPLYRIDRSFFHVTSNPRVRRAAGIKLGRCADIVANDPEFGHDDEAVARHWCQRAGIPWLGRADIGHDADNRIVPFGAP